MDHLHLLQPQTDHRLNCVTDKVRNQTDKKKNVIMKTHTQAQTEVQVKTWGLMKRHPQGWDEYRFYC